MIGKVGKGLLLTALLISFAGVAAAQEQHSLKFTEKDFDFGCVGVDFKVLHDFKLVNQGTTTIKVDTVTAHCDCTEVRFTDSVLAPGDTSIIKIIFSTANLYGPVEKDVKVVYNDPEMTSIMVYYSANIGQWLASIVPDPVSIFFLPGQKSKVARLQNRVLDKIEVTGVEASSDFISVDAKKAKASKGESLELEILPNGELSQGTHVGNFTVAVKPKGDLDPLRITIPVRVVKY